MMRETTPRLTSQFAKLTPRAFERADGDVRLIKTLARIEQRAEALRNKVIAHAAKFEDRWVAKEAMRIWERQLQQQRQHPGPAASEPGVSKNEIMRIAQRNIAARTNRRLSLVNAIRTRMENAVIRNRATQNLTPTFREAVTASPKQQPRQRRIQ